MKRVKKATKTAVQKIVKAVTLRQIEAASPCSGAYTEFLRAVKSNPVPDGRYTDAANTIYAAPQFTADAPIPLRYILNECKQTKTRRTFYMRWLMDSIPALKPLGRKIAAAESAFYSKQTAARRPLEKKVRELNTRINKIERPQFDRATALAKVVSGR